MLMVMTLGYLMGLKPLLIIMAIINQEVKMNLTLW